MNLNNRAIRSPIARLRRTGGFSSSDLLSRLAVGALLLGSFGLLWWSYEKVFSPQLKQSRELRTAASRLSAEVDELDRKWAKPDVDALNSKFALVSGRLFADQTAVNSWLAELKGQTAPLALNVETDAGKTISQMAGNEQFPTIATVAHDLTVTILPAAAGEPQSAYRRLLQLFQMATTQEKRVDLTELTVDADNNSISRAAMNFNFLTGGEARP